MSWKDELRKVLKLSVIIPVYNAEKYLSDCLESVLSQTLNCIEVICINDGSTDNSLEILEEYQKKDLRVKLINQKNQGVSAARNAGIALAEGEYIGFVDGDDTIEPDFFENLYNNAEVNQADTVWSKLSDNQDFNLFSDIFYHEEIKEMLLPLFFKEDQYNSVCNKIFSNRLIQKYHIVFPKGIKHGEDGQFNIQFLMYSNCVSFLDYCGYHYRETEGSATRNIVQHDYLHRAEEVYTTNWTPIIGDIISPEEIQELKKIRFANKIISLVYISANPENGLSFRKRWNELRKIVNSKQVSEVFSEINLKNNLNLNRYTKAVFQGIKKKNILKLYILTLYSYYRNK